MVHGGPYPVDVDVRALAPDRGFAIVPPDNHQYFGYQVPGAGEVNGDGLADLLAGNGADSPTVDGVRRDNSGQVFVIHGRTATTVVDADRLPAGAGARIVGGPFLDGYHTGSSLDGGRDVTGDGRTDLVIGSALLPGDPTADVGGLDVLTLAPAAPAGP
ncbi:FG-GAP repeat-containing protein [Streptomyces aidingensis]|uniref:FG-GAP repeat-containing protein n=1 Tax=Streptomyces aidingensis TaxID=910347 RepID=A0A1I1SMH7_9ACTN|nr:FG-GAP repeat-containing protein [Streptomyces aidingensis]